MSDRPWSRVCKAYISEPLDRLTCDIFSRVASSLLPSIGQLSMHVMTPNARATWNTKWCQLCNNSNILVTTWPITLKLRMHVWHPPGNASLCVTVGVRLHVRTCKASNVPRARAMFHFSRTAGPIALKLGILMGIS